MILFKIWVKYKDKSYNETKNVNKNSLFYSVFAIFLIFRLVELRK